MQKENKEEKIMAKRWHENWEGFQEGRWNQTSVNVRDFIQHNYTPYEGDDSFLAGPTEATTKLWEQVMDLSKQEREAGGVLDMDTKIVSTITSHGPGYLNKDMEKIKEIIAECDELMIRIKRFHKLHQTRWFKDYKPHGFDVQDLRIGALLQRTESCKNRLEMFINGEITEIPELDEPVLEENYTTNTWARTVTPNVLSHVC